MKSQSAKLIEVTIGAILLIGFFPFLKWAILRYADKEKKVKQEGLSRAEMLISLERLGYFKYVDQANLKKAKAIFEKNLDFDSVLPTHGDARMIIDYRLHPFDGEEVSNVNGVKFYAEGFKKVFEKFGLQFRINEYQDDFNPNTQMRNETISINGNKYVLYDNVKIDRFVWGASPKKLADIINKELEIQESEERLYLISGGNDGEAVFLNRDLYEYINKVFVDKWKKPLPPEVWLDLNFLGEN